MTGPRGVAPLDRARATVLPLILRGAARLAGRRPVIVPEYDLHPQSRYGWEGRAPLGSLNDLLEGWAVEHREDVIAALSELEEWCHTVPKDAGPAVACWENDYWGTLDAVWQVAALKRRNPMTYVEVGSGYSTLFARRAIDSFGLRTRIISIDPSPRQDVDRACDEVVRRPLEEVDLSLFADLDAGDIVFIDGSHVVTMNSDSVVFFLEVLPTLRRGVLVGIDDVYLPWDYHPTWAHRWYGEQYLLATYLLGGAGGDTIEFPGWVVARALSDEPRLESLWRCIENRFGRLGSSFWFERGRHLFD
jgi:hypothetical protein